MTRCFVCNRIKEDGNHWWILYLAHTLPSDRMSLTIAPLAAASGVEGSAFKATCGNSCTQKLVERWLQTGKLEPSHKPAGDPA